MSNNKWFGAILLIAALLVIGYFVFRWLKRHGKLECICKPVEQVAETVTNAVNPNPDPAPEPEPELPVPEWKNEGENPTPNFLSFSQTNKIK